MCSIIAGMFLAIIQVVVLSHILSVLVHLVRENQMDLIEGAYISPEGTHMFGRMAVVSFIVLMLAQASAANPQPESVAWLWLKSNSTVTPIGQHVHTLLVSQTG